MKKNTAGQYLTFGLAAQADGSPVLGASPVVYLTLDGAAQQVTSLTPSELGHGQYVVQLTKDETNADTIGFVALVGNAILAEKTIYTDPAAGASLVPVPGTGGNETVGTALEEVRWILQDLSPTQNYRYPDEQLLTYFNRALQEIRRLRPDLYIGRFGTGLPKYTSDDLDLVFPFSMMYYQPVIEYIAGFAELRDDEFTVDGRAGLLLNKFREHLTLVA